MSPNPTSHLSVGGDVVFGSIGLGSLAGVLPPAAALLTIIWIGLQIYTWYVNKGWQKRG